MNKDNAKEFLPLVQALADGKTIQYNTNEEWNDIGEIEFTIFDKPEDFRVKPEPRIWKVRFFKDGNIISTSSIDSLMEETQYITVQEVLE